MANAIECGDAKRPARACGAPTAFLQLRAMVPCPDMIVRAVNATRNYVCGIARIALDPSQ
jgi:hypothetical protein